MMAEASPIAAASASSPTSPSSELAANASTKSPSPSGPSDRLPKTNTSWCATKTAVFFLTFFSYVFFHACRKSFSAIKAEMADEQWMDSVIYPRQQQAQMYGLLDTLFMAMYAIGLFISGVLGDNGDLRRILSGGMWLTAAITLLFGVGAFLEIHSLGFFSVLWALNGLVQSCGFPANIAVMGKWFEQNERGAVLGIWSGNACLGNMVGTMLVAVMFEVLPKESAWKFAMVGVAILVGVHGTIMHFFLVPDPAQTPYAALNNVEDGKQTRVMEEKKMTVEGKMAVVASGEMAKSKTMMCGLVELSETSKGISFWDAWRIPGVLQYSLSYACLKSVNYALFFWLPFYLTASLGMDNSTANLYSMLFDVGQILGGSVAGFISDHMGVRSPVIVVMLALSWVTIYKFPESSYSIIGYIIFASGFMVGGPANLMATAIAADLGTHESIRGDAEALSTVTGIIDGTGSIGAAIVQYLVGYLADCHHVPKDCDPNSPNCELKCSWDPVFVLLEWGTILSGVCLLRLLYAEIMRLSKRRPTTVQQ